MISLYKEHLCQLRIWNYIGQLAQYDVFVFFFISEVITIYARMKRGIIGY